MDTISIPPPGATRKHRGVTQMVRDMPVGGFRDFPREWETAVYQAAYRARAKVAMRRGDDKSVTRFWRVA